MGICALAWLGGLLAQTDASPKTLSAPEWRAGVISKLPAYIEWPEERLGAPTNALRVAVLTTTGGNDETLTLLRALLQGTRVNGRLIEVAALTNPGDVAACHLVYVPEESSARWWEAAPSLELRGVVTVGESGEFLRRGGVFNLRTAARKLEVDRRNAARAGVTISSKLLRIAVVQ